MMNENEVYLDHAASSHIVEEIADHLYQLYLNQLGNSSSIHRSGVKAMTILEKSRIAFAKKLNCKSEDIFFTSGATESNNIILQGFIKQNYTSEKNEIIISEFEHSSVLETLKGLSKIYNLVIHKIKILKNGLVDTDHLNNLITNKTLLVSVMHVNNEIGTIQPTHKIAEICKKRSIFFHVDGAQAFCKTKIDLNQNLIGAYTFSGHKIHGPKGIGGFYLNPNFKLEPLFFGGGHESGMRAGTVAVELISAFAQAISLFDQDRLDHLKSLRIYFEEQLAQNKKLKINISNEMSIANIVNFQVVDRSAKEVMQLLDKNNIRVSIGSACKATNKSASHVLLALGLTEEEAFSSLRVSFGIKTTKEEIMYFFKVLNQL